MRPRIVVFALALVAAASIPVRDAGAQDAPPWVDESDVPLPSWTKSVSPSKSDAAVYLEPGKIEARRGSLQLGARLPLYATQRARGCGGRWLEVGPMAWVCSDVAEYSPDDPSWLPIGTRPWTSKEGTDFFATRHIATTLMPPIAPAVATDDGLPFRYYFAAHDGVSGFRNLANALDDAPDQELEQGFSIATLEERTAHGESWVQSKKRRWFASRELVPVRSFLFHGVTLDDGTLDFAWVVTEKASVFGSEKGGTATGVRTRFEQVKTLEMKNAMMRIEDARGQETWMRAKDLAHPHLQEAPREAAVNERWIDVDLAEQTLVAYKGARPVFATIVSTGKGPKGSDTATPTGAHRIWVKIFTTKMDNLDKEEIEHHYAIEDVPYVQFFDKAVALHGAFWHHDFGHVHSHGCVNLAPIDARWLFAFTGPHLPQGWTAAYPTKLELGTLVRVH